MKEIETGKFIYVYGEVANEGTLVLIDKYDFKGFYSKIFLDKYKKIIENDIKINTKKIKNINTFFGTEEVKEIGKGGIYAKLWDMAKESNLGMDFSQKDIPINQFSLEICNYFEINPYRLLTKQSYLIFETFEWYEKFTKINTKNKIKCIGRLYNKKECARIDGDTKAYLTKDHKDEIDTIIKNYTKSIK